MHKRAIDNERTRINGLPDAEREAAITEFLRDAGAGNEVAALFQQKILDHCRRMRILCLCESDRSMLMWSHYADCHRGVVLGFDARAMENGWKRPLEPVKYCDAPPFLINSEKWTQSIVYGLPHPGLEGDEREWALTKHTDWQYEREWRYVCVAEPGTPGEHEDIKFPSNALVEVVSGCRTNPKDSAELSTLARAIQPEVRHFRMAIHPSRFELIKSELEREMGHY